MKLEDRVSIVTGAGQGIGEAIALKFAEEGSHIVVNDVDSDKADAVAEKVEKTGAEALSIKADVTNRDEVQDMVEKAIENFDRINVLVNNAGIQTDSAYLELSEEEWNRVLDVNLKGVYLCSQEVAHHMLEEGGGKIINVSSIHQSVPRFRKAHYDASKAGLEMLSKDMALELAEHKINVNCVSPGAIATPMNEEIIRSPKKSAKLNSRIPFGRIGKPEEVARVVLFLASDDADYLTGANVTVDGGLSLV